MTAIDRILFKARQLDAAAWALADVLADTLETDYPGIGVTPERAFRQIADHADRNPAFIDDLNAIAEALFADVGEVVRAAELN